ncbi:DNA-binding GntR family transcriptional regulator [Bradyrhizobium sp. F1.13.1]
MTQDVRSRLSAFRGTQLRQGDRIRRSREEHESIMQAIAEGDGETAARRMRAHMLNAAAALRRYIADRFGGQDGGLASDNAQ